MAYAQSLSAVAHLLRRGGEAGVRRLIDVARRRPPAAEALPAAFALSYGELQRDWEAHLAVAAARRRRPRAASSTRQRSRSGPVSRILSPPLRGGRRSFL